MMVQVGKPSLGELRQYPLTKVPLLRTYGRTYWFFGKPAAFNSPNPDASGLGIETALPAPFQ
jgi:hypothetical protein